MIDISKSLEIQKEQIEYWIGYLKTHLDSDEDLSIIVVGNRLDEIKDKKSEKEASTYLKEISNYMEDLKDKLIYGYTILSAKKVMHIEDLISVLQQKCNSFDKTKFMIPKLYKMTAESLQNTNVPLLMGKLDLL